MESCKNESECKQSCNGFRRSVSEANRDKPKRGGRGEKRQEWAWECVREVREGERKEEGETRTRRRTV